MGYNEKLEQHVKEKSHSIFSHGHPERSLSYILLLYQSYSELLYGQMIDKYCRKSGPFKYKEELTSYHVWICKFLTCSISKRNVKDFFNTSKCLADDVKLLWQLFFLASYSILGELYSWCGKLTKKKIVKATFSSLIVQ